MVHSFKGNLINVSSYCLHYEMNMIIYKNRTIIELLLCTDNDEGNKNTVY